MKWLLKASIVTLLLLALLTSSLVGCSSDNPLEDWEPGQPITIDVGKKFYLSLESNQTTGYRWQLAEPLDENILKLLSNEYEEPESDVVGAAGKEKWTFKAVGKGTTEISMEYIRPFEENEPPMDSKSFTIIVE